MVHALPPNVVQPSSRAAWRQWLGRNHGRTDGIWVVSFKKSSGKAGPGYEALVQEALCFGWIDSKPRRLDEARYMLWFAPRKAGSGWSVPNQRRVNRLILAGLMAKPGLAKVLAAKADGSWSKLETVEALAVPEDLARALAGAAARNFDAFPRSAKRGILEWILQAKRPETRAKRIAETARLAARNQRANQWPR